MFQARLSILGKGMLITLLASHAIASHAIDTGRGEQLFTDNCVACHVSLIGGDGSALLTRPDRRVHNLRGLSKQVNFCKDNLGLPWFDDQVGDVVDYLNQRYYKFTP